MGAPSAMAQGAERDRWNAWGRSTAAAIAGAAAVLITVTIAFGDARRDASDAKKGVEKLEPRVTEVENRISALDVRGSTRYENLIKRLDAMNDESLAFRKEIRDDIKELLRRLPK